MWSIFKRGGAQRNKPAVKKKASGSHALLNTPSHRDDYRAVKILCKRTACESAKRMSEKVFLCGEAPWLPLSDCSDTARCQCRYLRLADRRSFSRRDVDNGLPGKTVAKERRRMGDRRKPASADFVW